MTRKAMRSLREARETDTLAEFIAERKDQAPADRKAFDATLNSMVGKSKSEPETFPPDCDDD